MSIYRIENGKIMLETIFGKVTKLNDAPENRTLVAKFDDLVFRKKEGFRTMEIITFGHNMVWRTGIEYSLGAGNRFTKKDIAKFVKSVIEKQKARGFTEKETFEMAKRLKGNVEILWYDENYGPAEKLQLENELEPRSIVYVKNNGQLSKIYYRGDNYFAAAVVKSLEGKIVKHTIQKSYSTKRKTNLLAFLKTDNKNYDIRYDKFYVEYFGPRGILGKIEYRVNWYIVTSAYFLSSDLEIVGKYYDGKAVYHVRNGKFQKLTSKIFRCDEPREPDNEFRIHVDLTSETPIVSWISDEMTIQRLKDGQYFVICHGEYRGKVLFESFPWEAYEFGGGVACS